jgi:hypothetical protein
VKLRTRNFSDESNQSVSLTTIPVELLIRILPSELSNTEHFFSIIYLGNMSTLPRFIPSFQRGFVNTVIIVCLINSCQNQFVSAFQPLISVFNERQSVSNAVRCLKFSVFAKSGKNFLQNDIQSSKGASGDVRLKTRKKMQSTRVSRPLPVTDEELANHVSSMYTHGSTGVVRQVMKKRERIEKRASEPRDSLDTEQRDYLRMLDKHLTLVLNADYQPLSVLPLSSRGLF